LAAIADAAIVSVFLFVDKTPKIMLVPVKVRKNSSKARRKIRE
jgi:hypothetical protein